jgi:Lhr-like helicase
MVLQSIGTIQADPLIPVYCEIPKETHESSKLWVTGKRNENNCIGYVGEFYADTIKPGDRFLLAGKVWERSGGDFQQIVAKPHEGTPQQLRWPGNRPPKSAPLCKHLFSLRTLAKEKLLEGAKALRDWLRLEMPLKISDSIRISDWFEQQERKSEIPDASSILVESINTNEGHSSDYDIHLPFPAGICSKLGQLLLFRIKKNYGDQPITGISTAATNLGLRILDSENTLVKICNNLSQTPVQLIQTFFCDENWLPDLRSALFGSDLHRRKFQESAHLSLMIPPPSSNANQRTRVGGRDWPARRLFDRVISMDPPLLPITQSTLELISIPEIQSLSTWFDNQSKVFWKSRELTSASPFALTWNLPSTQNGNPGDDDDLTLASFLEALGDA